jgi:glycosyltransferase involved in cell wall biosynthesis
MKIEKYNLLSYIIPSYNAADFLEETVDSIYKQNLNIPFEIIISDDNSSDNTPNVILKLAKKHKEIKYFLNKENRGAPGNRNFAIKHCNGDLIYMLDHDNVLDQDSIQKLINTINQRNVNAASFGELYFFKGKRDNHRGSWYYNYPNNLFTIQEYIRHTNSPAASNNYMFTRTAFNKTGGYPDRGARENMGFGLRLVATGTPIAIVPGTKYFHRILASGMWMDENKNNPEVAHKNMALNFREFINLFDDKSQKLINSKKAEKTADLFIKNKSLYLSKKGQELAGDNYVHTNKPKQKKIRSTILKNTYIKNLTTYYRTIFIKKPNLIKRFNLLKVFLADYNNYNKINNNKKFFNKNTVLKPCIYEKTINTEINSTYFYQDTWCAGKIFKNKPEHHYDVGSNAEMVGIISQFVPTTMVDIRPIKQKLKNLDFIKGDILALPFKNNLLESISSICVVEHIGLGRYDDKLDPFGSEKAIKELIRVLAPSGNLYISLPIDNENKIYFNAHRAFTRKYVLELFKELELIEEVYINKHEPIDSYEELKGFGTGFFHFKKR